MRAGAIAQADAPRDLYFRPRDLFVANFVGEAIVRTYMAYLPTVASYGFERGISLTYTLLGDPATRDQIPGFSGYPTLLLFGKGMQHERTHVGFEDSMEQDLETWIPLTGFPTLLLLDETMTFTVANKNDYSKTLTELESEFGSGS